MSKLVVILCQQLTRELDPPALSGDAPAWLAAKLYHQVPEFSSEGFASPRRPRPDQKEVLVFGAEQSDEPPIGPMAGNLHD